MTLLLCRECFDEIFPYDYETDTQFYDDNDTERNLLCNLCNKKLESWGRRGEGYTYYGVRDVKWIDILTSIQNNTDVDLEEEVGALKEEVRVLKEELNSLREMILHLPQVGSVYKDAKHRFEGVVKSQRKSDK